MSEFSESYHLRSEDAEDAVKLLRRAKRRGFVYQPVNGWVTFLAEGGVFEPDKRIVSAASHPLLHYVSAEDHGWSFTLYDHGKVASRYRCDWGNEIEVDDSGYSSVVLRQFVPSVQAALLDDLERHLHPKDFDELFDVEASKLLAQALGLEHYDWLSFNYVADDLLGSSRSHDDVIQVS